MSVVSFFERALRPRVFAHRGGCALGPENTMAAFERGLAAGADGLELDVHLSSDGVVVVCHDATLDRTTDASGRIDRRTAAELSRVDAGYRWTDPQGNHPFRSCGIGVPTLRDVLRPLPGRPDHHRDEGRSPRDGAGPGSRGPGRIGGRSRVCGIGWPSGDSSCAGGTASHGQQRVPLGNPPCSLSLMGALARSSNGVWRVSGAGDRWHDSRRIAYLCGARTRCGARGTSLDRG